MHIYHSLVWSHEKRIVVGILRILNLTLILTANKKSEFFSRYSESQRKLDWQKIHFSGFYYFCYRRNNTNYGAEDSQCQKTANPDLLCCVVTKQALKNMVPKGDILWKHPLMLSSKIGGAIEDLWKAEVWSIKRKKVTVRVGHLFHKKCRQRNRSLRRETRLENLDVSTNSNIECSHIERFSTRCTLNNFQAIFRFRGISWNVFHFEFFMKC